MHNTDVVVVLVEENLAEQRLRPRSCHDSTKTHPERYAAYSEYILVAKSTPDIDKRSKLPNERRVLYLPSQPTSFSCSSSVNMPLLPDSSGGKKDDYSAAGHNGDG
jgi:hypothetical protein